MLTKAFSLKLPQAGRSCFQELFSSLEEILLKPSGIILKSPTTIFTASEHSKTNTTISIMVLDIFKGLHTVYANVSL